MRKTLVLSLTILTAGTVLGQHAGHEPAADCPMKKEAAASPYSGQETRDIKALSDDERRRLLAGHGMGMALPAELNRYPGPKHVLELAGELDLRPEQIDAAETIFDAMDERARQLGRRLIELEADLDERFSRGEIDEDVLSKIVLEIGQVRGELRLTHLRAHLQMRAAMNEDQIADYDRLRGYRH
jgi:hypothetical protein